MKGRNLSQNEYSHLFARRHVGLNPTTEYFSSGEFTGVDNTKNRPEWRLNKA